MRYGHLQRMYAGEAYYWGREPNEFARLVFNFLPGRSAPGSLKAVDLGAGEGRDAVLFASRGIEVLAVDVATNALEKALRLAREKGVSLEVEQDDVNEIRLRGTFDLVYSIGTLQYIEPRRRPARFEHFKEHTSPGGIHALFAFVDDPRLPPAPDWGQDEYLYRPGGLPEYYADWNLLYSRSFVFDDDSADIPHRHAAEQYVFERPL